MDFEVFIPHVMQFAPGCAEPTAVHHIRQAAIEFCKRTRLWRLDTQIAVTEASNDVIAAPTDAEIFEIEEARTVAGCVIEPISRADLKEKHPSWRSWISGEPRYITQSMPDTVRLIPSFNGNVDLSLFLQPSEQAQTLPDFLSKYASTIAWGALAELLLLPQKDFANPSLAEFNGARFDAELASLSTGFMRGQQRARTRTQARYF